MYKNIIFDIGNVLLSFKPTEYLNQYYDKDTIEKLMQYIFRSKEWIELDLGNLLIEDVIEILTNRHPDYTKEITFVLKNWTDMLIPIKDNIDLLIPLKEKGYHLYLLSNFHIEAIDTVFKQYDFFNLFEGGIISGHHHIIKPDPHIYHKLLNEYHLNNHECVFIDDSLENIIEANNQGILGIHLTKNNLLQQLNLCSIL